MAGTDLELSRRELLLGGALALGAAALWPLAARAAAEPAWLEVAKKSPLVRVSPLLKDGKESRCHGEVWFFLDGGDVVLATATKTWKVRAVESGRDRARIWAADSSSAPSFTARASIDKDRAAFDRLLAAYAVKYPDEWGKWKPRFESSYADGTRVVLRYSPIGS